VTTSDPLWQVSVDTGGTFTDAIGIAPSGELRRAKVLSSSALRARIRALIAPDIIEIDQSWGVADDFPGGWSLGAPPGHPSPKVSRFSAALSLITLDGPIASSAKPGAILDILCPDEAPILAARVLTQTPALLPLPPIFMRLATTRGTNALLTRSFPPVALFTTRGLGDLCEIGTQQRPDLFALDIRKPPLLHARTIEIDERLAADGAVLQPIDTRALERDARAVLGSGIRIAAVALLHADLNPVHELAAAAILRRLGFNIVALSHEVSPFVKLLPRSITTIVEAALAPIVSTYLARIQHALPGGRLDILTSAGSLVPARDFRAIHSLLSGPAGGLVGAAAAARTAAEPHVLAFDMGGTSTDVSRYAGSIAHVFEHTVGPATLIAPAVDIHTVAAGGGSICAFDGTALTVGPASAGADPGPACYGRGGPLALTDIQLLSGRLAPRSFGVPLDEHAAYAAFDALVERMGLPRARATSVLDGLLDIAAERIAGAIRVVSSRRGHDPAAATLLAFGGAGGQIACIVAERLGIRRVLIPPDAGLLSARGLFAAPFQHIAQRQVLRPLDDPHDSLDQTIAELTREATTRVRAMLDERGDPAGPIRCTTVAALRAAGQETPIEIELQCARDARPNFEIAYERIYGYRAPDGGIEVVWLRAIASGASAGGVRTESLASPARQLASQPRLTRSMRTAGIAVDALIIDRAVLTPGRAIAGPALIVEPHCTTVVDSGWNLTVLPDGSLRLDIDRSAAPRARPTLAATEVELFTSRVESAARSMGEALQRTSFSVNVKERLDYSCAVLDSRAGLVACAPHVPVHLGSLGVCVRETLRHIAIAPRDAVVTNHPACGGSHLPDLTVIAGAFDDHANPIGYVAARAHHAEIGGIRPGSMPPSATRLIDEGVVIPPMCIVHQGVERFDDLRRLLTSRPHPTRALHANLEDIRAAIAACARGVVELESLARAHSPARLAEMLEAIQSRSARAAAEAVVALQPLDLALADELDDGSPLRVRITARDNVLTFDFTGSAPVHSGNLNATPAIVTSCLVYLMRLLCGRDLPLNEGLMRPVRIILPEGMLNPPFLLRTHPATLPAVVGGNIETSQRLVNLLVRGLGLAAESQGTMNNLIFGDERSSYYETICGGAGAGPGFDGASAVHTHMTNTRITDPEILERRYPVRLERFAVRRGSGGRARFRGGDGVERIIRFLAPMSVSVLTQRRVNGPRGLDGGGDGQPGRQWIERADGSTTPLAHIDGAQLAPGDALVMQTPGGGGMGGPPTSRSE